MANKRKSKKIGGNLQYSPELKEHRSMTIAKKVAHLSSGRKAVAERAMFALPSFNPAAPSCTLDSTHVDTLVLSVVKSFHPHLNITLGTDLGAIGIDEPMRENYQPSIVSAMQRQGCGLGPAFSASAVGQCNTVQQISTLTFNSRM